MCCALLHGERENIKIEMDGGIAIKVFDLRC